MAFTVEDPFQTSWRITYGPMTYSERKCQSPSRIPKRQGGRTPQGGPGGPLSSTSCSVPECQGEVRSIMPCPDSQTYSYTQKHLPCSHTFWVCFVLFLLTITGEGNGNPLQYSCLENPRDRGAWWGHTELDMTEAT